MCTVKKGFVTLLLAPVLVIRPSPPPPPSKVQIPSSLHHVYNPLLLRNLRHKNLVQLVALVFQGSALKGIVLEVMGKVCVCMCIHECMCVCVCMYVYVRVCVYVCDVKLLLPFPGLPTEVYDLTRTLSDLPSRTAQLCKVNFTAAVFPSPSPPLPSLNVKPLSPPPICITMITSSLHHLSQGRLCCNVVHIFPEVCT